MNKKRLCLFVISFVVGCQVVHVREETKEGNTLSYTRCSVGADFLTAGLSVIPGTNGMHSFTAANTTSKEQEAFVALCKTIDQLAQTVAQVYGLPKTAVKSKLEK